MQKWKPTTTARVPAKLMEPINDPAEWYPDQLADGHWIYTLNDTEISEILTAVSNIEQSGQELSEIGINEFQLPKFSAVLKEIRAELTDGRGFALIRGLPKESMSRYQMAIAFWGIGNHIGIPKSQNKQGHLLGHVKDLGGDYSKVRGYLTQAAMGFHSDSADILSLGCMHPAKAGGEHRICSSVALYNQMLKERPDLVEALTFRFYKVRKGKIPPGEKNPWIRQPIFSVTDGYFSARGPGSHLEKAQKVPGVPALTELQKEALDMYRSLAPKLAIDIDFQPGDISFVYNHVTLHARTDFEDWPEDDRKRHLLRLWLSTNCRPVHPDIAYVFRGVPIEGNADPTPLEAN